mmetsp:Transcript_17551/g.27066  ORF Transcript_17551/g.27066 Transcript_17551/m.27066 type:complete len:104 (-) Transcript_17551:61-372(-)
MVTNKNSAITSPVRGDGNKQMSQAKNNFFIRDKGRKSMDSGIPQTKVSAERNRSRDKVPGGYYGYRNAGTSANSASSRSKNLGAKSSKSPNLTYFGGRPKTSN